MIIYHYFAREMSGKRRVMAGMFESDSGVRSSDDYHNVAQAIKYTHDLDCDIIIESLSIVSPPCTGKTNNSGE